MERTRDMEQAEEAVKQKTLSIQNLSHQIRTPLNIILGFANVMLDHIVSYSKKAGSSRFHEENLNDITGMMKTNVISSPLAE